jgi:predicted 3-demethylubiquinone-9 3-methyltransferase (glyoxalase superfamily)
MIVPCIWLDDTAAEAAELYTDTFPDARETARSFYPASAENPSGRPPGSVLTIEVELAGQRFTLLNGGPLFAPNQTISFFVMCPQISDVDRIVAALGAGGQTMMELGSYSWSQRYAWIADRFGVSWQVMQAPGTGTRIVPCLMFSDAVAGRAEEALEHYAQVLGGQVTMLEHYAPGAGPEGMLVHGRASFGAGELVAMDSHVSHSVTFNEGVSLQVMAPDQETVDRWWAGLSEGGAPGVCGWLTDRFGLSWQVTPTSIATWLACDDVAARDRAFAAMMTMTKPDIAALERAFTGE